MKVNVELESKSLTSGLRFHGETYADKIVVEKISELSDFLDDILDELRHLNWSVEDRNEVSAKDIKKQLEKLEKALGISLSFEEEE